MEFKQKLKEQQKALEEAKAKAAGKGPIGEHWTLSLHQERIVYVHIFLCRSRKQENHREEMK